MSKPRYGDNIFELGCVVDGTLKAADWSTEKRDAILITISTAPNYDDAVAICRQYITIADDK